MSPRTLVTISLTLVLGLHEVGAQSSDVWDVIDNLPQLKRFKSLCGDLRLFYQNVDSVTVFAFIDNEYNSMTADQAARFRSLVEANSTTRREFCRTFTVLPQLNLTASAPEKIQASNGLTLYIARRHEWGNVQSPIIYVNGAMVNGTDHVATNGMVYLLDRVPDLPSGKTIYEWIESNGGGFVVNTTILTRLLERVWTSPKHLDILASLHSRDMTLFLPSNKALARIPQGMLDGLSDDKLAEYIRLHIIPRRVIYTSLMFDQESVTNDIYKQTQFYKTGDNVMIKSGGVVASIVQGDIPTNNGVVHVIDEMFGLIYRSLLEQIQQRCPFYGRLVNKTSDENITKEISQGATTVFVPTNEAFNRVRKLIDFDQNTTILDFVMRLSMVKDGNIDVSMNIGNYYTRQRRVSQYHDWKLVFYRDRNENWMNGGNVIAKILTPAIETTSGTMYVIDAVLGIPSMDIPNIINHDYYLQHTYLDLKSVGLLEYLENQCFNTNALLPTEASHSTHNVVYSTTRASHNADNDVDMHMTTKTNRGTNSDVYTTTQSPDGQAALHNESKVRCGNCSHPCQFTYFVPNGSAILDYKMTSHGRQISTNPGLYRHILRRSLILDNLIFLEEMPVSAYYIQLTRNTNDTLFLRKDTDYTASLRWVSPGHPGTVVTARVLFWDIGATNGIVHVIDKVLSHPEDVTIELDKLGSSATIIG